MVTEKQVTEAIEKVFGIKVSPQQVCPGNEDPGGWASNAHAVIYHHGNMPSIERIEEWGQVSNLLPDWYYVEAINSEISAVFSL